MIRCFTFCLPLLILFVGASASAGADEEPGFRPLFDGRTFQGWEGNLDIFRIVEGAIVGGTLERRIPNNEFLCTEATFGDFELRLQAKLIGEGKNAGVQFRTKRIPDHHEVIGYQCDMGETAERTIWGSLYDESRRRRFLAQGDDAKVRKVLKDGDWNDLVIRCEGPRIRLWVNSLLTVDYTEEDDAIERDGVIGLQIHGGAPAEAWYRNIRVKELQTAN